MRIGTRIVLGLALTASALLAQTANPPEAPGAPGADDNAPASNANSKAPAKQSAARRNSHRTPPPLVLPPLPSGPLTQVPMDQIPAEPAKVTFQGGLLSISAQNSTLGEILRDVRKLTGAAIELPAGSGANERVVTHLGPGSPRDVLVSLLNGSSYNYVMLGSSADPAAVASVILTSKEGAGAQPQTVVANAQNRFPQQPPHPFGARVVPMPGNGVAEPDADADEPADDTQEAEDTPDDQTQPQPEETGVNAAAPQASDPNQPNAGPKTPEQVLEMLRRPQQVPGAVINNAPQPAQPPQDQDHD